MESYIQIKIGDVGVVQVFFHKVNEITSEYDILVHIGIIMVIKKSWKRY